jgi:CRISPR-associated endonuclease/helicase Cas3
LRPSEFVYERFVLLRSYLALVDRCTVTLPGDVERLVESVYRTAVPPRATASSPGDIERLVESVSGDEPLPVPPTRAWAIALKEAEKKMHAAQEEDCKAARTFLIAKPVDENEILYEFNQELEEDNPEVPKDRQAFTRLVERSVSLIVLYQIDGKLYLDPDGKRRVSLTGRPNLEDARGFLGNAVTIQQKGCVFHYLKQEPPKAWQKSGLLRFHRVALVNEEGAALLEEDQYPLTVHPLLGVQFTRPEDQRA